MIDFDIQMVRTQMVKAVQVITHFRRLAKEIGYDREELGEMERQFREAAGELQRVEKAAKEDKSRPLIG